MPSSCSGKSLTPESVQAFLDRHKDPADARRFLQDAGLIDENGELAKPYRPDCAGSYSRMGRFPLISQ